MTHVYHPLVSRNFLSKVSRKQRALLWSLSFEYHAPLQTNKKNHVFHKCPWEIVNCVGGKNRNTVFDIKWMFLRADYWNGYILFIFELLKIFGKLWLGIHVWKKFSFKPSQFFRTKKKIAAVHFPIVPNEPYAAQKELFCTFLWALLRISCANIRIMGKDTSRHLFFFFYEP